MLPKQQTTTKSFSPLPQEKREGGRTDGQTDRSYVILPHIFHSSESIPSLLSFILSFEIHWICSSPVFPLSISHHKCELCQNSSRRLILPQCRSLPAPAIFFFLIESERKKKNEYWTAEWQQAAKNKRYHSDIIVFVSREMQLVLLAIFWDPAWILFGWGSEFRKQIEYKKISPVSPMSFDSAESSASTRKWVVGNGTRIRAYVQFCGISTVYVCFSNQKANQNGKLWTMGKLAS